MKNVIKLLRNNKINISIVIISLFILAAIGYFIYIYFFDKRYILLFKGPLRLTGNYSDFVDNLKLPLSKVGHKFTYIFWINFKNIPENALWNEDFKYKKTIMSRYGSPVVYYIPKEHILRIGVTYKNDSNEIKVYSLDLDNLRMQKWLHVAIVLDNKNLNIYIDGKLKKSGIMTNLPFIYNKNLLLGEKNNNFNGLISNGKYYNYALSKNAIILDYESNDY